MGKCVNVKYKKCIAMPKERDALRFTKVNII